MKPAPGTTAPGAATAAQLHAREFAQPELACDRSHRGRMEREAARPPPGGEGRMALEKSKNKRRGERDHVETE